MAKDDPIALEKEKDPIRFLINLFSILDNVSSEKEITLTGNTFTIREKQPEEIIKFKADTVRLKTKIVQWFDDRSSTRLYLDDEKSCLFKECVHAAYYFVTENNDSSDGAQFFIKFYTHLKSKDII